MWLILAYSYIIMILIIGPFFMNQKLSNTKFVITMVNQPTFAVGVIGPVAHGKTTIVRKISENYSWRSKQEIMRNMSIKLGYSNCTIFKKYITRKYHNRYHMYNSSNKNNYNLDSFDSIFKFSFIDCPGHKYLLSTLLTGVSIMQACILILSPEPILNTSHVLEQIILLSILEIGRCIVVVNKIDLFKRKHIFNYYITLKNIFTKTDNKYTVIIPCSKNFKIIPSILFKNINYKYEKRTGCITLETYFLVCRTFSIKNFEKISPDIFMGTFGGRSFGGFLALGQPIEIRPGVYFRNLGLMKPIITRILSIFDYKKKLDYVIPGGLVALGTKINSELTRNDNLAGTVVGDIGMLPRVYSKIMVSYKIIRSINTIQKPQLNKNRIGHFLIKRHEIVLIHALAINTPGIILELFKNFVIIELINPICLLNNSNILLSKLIENNWKLVAWGAFKEGLKIGLI